MEYALTFFFSYATVVTLPGDANNPMVIQNLSDLLFHPNPWHDK